jgi:hypothetical protein
MKRNNVLKRLSARPRMNARSTGDGESWHVRVTMFLSDAEKFVGRPRPIGSCELMQKYSWACSPDSRRRCASCIDLFDWNEKLLSLAVAETEFSFYSYSSGPGRGFAHEPSVYVPKGSRNKRAPIVRVTQHGGLDI